MGTASMGLQIDTGPIMPPPYGVPVTASYDTACLGSAPQAQVFDWHSVSVHYVLPP